MGYYLYTTTLANPIDANFTNDEVSPDSSKNDTKYANSGENYGGIPNSNAKTENSTKNDNKTGVNTSDNITVDQDNDAKKAVVMNISSNGEITNSSTMLDSMLKTMFLPKEMKMLSKMKAMQLAAFHPVLILHPILTVATMLDSMLKTIGNNAGLNAEDNVPAKGNETVIKNEGNAVGSIPSSANTTPHTNSGNNAGLNAEDNVPAKGTETFIKMKGMQLAAFPPC
ncbi:hypothetical protein WDU94_011189 [Cyamophila willieti]